MIALKVVSLITVWGCWMSASVSIADAQTSLGELKGLINQAEGALTLTLANRSGGFDLQRNCSDSRACGIFAVQDAQ